MGGTSLINANVAIVPDEEVFEGVDWPRAIAREIVKYYYRARAVLAAAPHPHAARLLKFQALQKRARELDLDTSGRYRGELHVDGQNNHGVEQQPCNDCGNCVSGCNVEAKNTLYMNYLPMARNAGATILTQTKVEWLEKLAGGGWRIHGQYVTGTERQREISRWMPAK